MENINFSLNELEINKQVSRDEVNIDDLSIFLGYEDMYDIEHMKLYYSTNYTIKALTQILQYYGLTKNKMVKEEMIQVLLFFETDPENKFAVERRLRLWRNIHELKTDPYFSKYILF
jgi:hypothetical protein